MKNPLIVRRIIAQAGTFLGYLLISSGVAVASQILCISTTLNKRTKTNIKFSIIISSGEQTVNVRKYYISGKISVFLQQKDGKDRELKVRRLLISLSARPCRGQPRALHAQKRRFYFPLYYVYTG